MVDERQFSIAGAAGPGDDVLPCGYSAAVGALARLHARTGGPDDSDWAEAALAARLANQVPPTADRFN